ncbi:MAG TPA: phosphatase PAP2 family protein [Thermoanaerobaculia bacterium]|nr:phosphatase PAP2 family protein [Thermoanaerobaculia bacterium]
MTRRAVAFSAVAITSTAAFALLASAVTRRHTAHTDRKLLGKTAARDKRVRRAANAVHPAGKWYVFVPVAVVAAGIVLARGADSPRRRVAGAAAIVAAALASAIVNPALDAWLPQPPVPPGRRTKPKPSFPSGHTFSLGAVMTTAAYVLAEERIVSPQVAVPVALLIPVLAGTARMVEEKHWPSDVGGGALVAAVISACCLALYEANRESGGKSPLPPQRERVARSAR